MESALRTCDFPGDMFAFVESMRDHVKINRRIKEDFNSGKISKRRNNSDAGDHQYGGKL